MWRAVWTKAETHGLSTAIHSANVDNSLGRASLVSRSPSTGSIGDNRFYARTHPRRFDLCGQLPPTHEGAHLTRGQDRPCRVQTEHVIFRWFHLPASGPATSKFSPTLA